jgi:hypothetical protein
MAPSVMFPYLYILITIAVHENSRFDMAVELLVGSMTVGVSIFAYLHLLVLMSLYFGWKGTPLTLTISLASGWFYVITVMTMRLSDLGRCGIFGLTSLIWLAVMAALQILIVRRLTELAELA